MVNKWLINILSCWNYQGEIREFVSPNWVGPMSKAPPPQPSQARSQGGVGGVVRPPPVAHPKDFVPPFSNFVPPFSNFVPPFSNFVPPFSNFVPPFSNFVPPFSNFVPPFSNFVPPFSNLFHPWNMWMTSRGQCPRGGCAWCSTHPSSDPPPHLAGWLRACIPC